MQATQITYAYFCLLGGLNHPHTWTVNHYNGKHYTHTTYHLS